jgi:hypothetical protein
MPIIEPVHDQRVPLSQGDILKGVSLFSTKKSWTDGGGEPDRTNRGLALVVSRPCAAAHDEWVLVAAVEKYKNKPPAEFESYDEAKQFFIEIRDGLTTPDQFYLGQIPGYEGSFCGRLDSLHTIQVPKSGTDERQAFLAAARLKSLLLHGCGIGDEGADTLARSPILANVEYLELSMNDLTDEAARALAASSYLARLKQGGLVMGSSNYLTEDGWQALRARFGDAVVAICSERID